MKNLVPLVLFSLIVFWSCSSEEEAIKPTDTSNPEILQDLDQSSWKLVGCPDNEFLFINGHSECDYLAKLSFEHEKVMIVHENSTYKLRHFICFVDGKKLTVSLQECANTTWESLFEWTVVNHTAQSLVLDITAPNLAPGYEQRFEFARTQ